MAKGRRRLILGMAMLVAACQPETVTTTTVSVAPPSTASTTTSTTTSVDEEPVDICSRGMVWEAGTTYAADCFVRPMSFVPQDDGWGSLGGGDGHLLIRWNDPEDRSVYVRIALISYLSQRSPEEVLASILQADGVVVVDGPFAIELADAVGVGTELEGAPEEGPRRPFCTTGNTVWFAPVQYGHGFYELDRHRVAGVGACDLVQAWLVDVDGSTVTILAGTEDPENHPVAVDAAERLFASMTFLPTP